MIRHFLRLVIRGVSKHFAVFLLFLVGYFIWDFLPFHRDESLLPRVANGIPQLPATQHVYRWQNVTSSLGLIVFSAFIDDRNGTRVVRLIAIGRRKEFVEPRSTWCYLWKELALSSVPRVVEGSIRVMKPYENTRYEHLFIECGIKSNEHPLAVSISMDKTLILNNWVPVKYPSLHRDFAVCLPPITWGYKNPHELVSTFEFNRLLGAERFYIYNMTVRPEINKILVYYQKQGVLEVLDWTYIKRWNDGDIHYNAQENAMNECLYRNLGETSFVAFSDLDEILVPQQHSNWHQLFRELKKQPEFNTSGSFLFRNAFFFKDGPDDTTFNISSEAFSLHIESLLKTQHRKNLEPFKSRSKQFVIPERIAVVLTHFSLEFKVGFKHFNVPAEMGLNHHYRMSLQPTDLKSENLVIDRSAHRFSDLLIQHVRQVWKDVNVTRGL